jgi:hypothetical protein
VSRPRLRKIPIGAFAASASNSSSRAIDSTAACASAERDGRRSAYRQPFASAM